MGAPTRKEKHTQASEFHSTLLIIDGPHQMIVRPGIFCHVISEKGAKKGEMFVGSRGSVRVDVESLSIEWEQMEIVFLEDLDRFENSSKPVLILTSRRQCFASVYRNERELFV